MQHLFDLKISYRTVPVYLVEELEGGESVGLWADPYEDGGPYIKVAHCAKGPDRVNCIVHEILHAVKFFYGPTSETKACTFDDIEEAFITQLATGFTQVLADNPALGAWIRDMLNSGPLEVAQVA